MPEAPQRWTPGVASLVGNLRSTIDEGVLPSGELPVRDVPVDCYVGLDHEGWKWVRVTCDPRSVVADNRAGAIRFNVLPNGYRVAVDPSTDPNVSSYFLDNILELLRGGAEPAEAGRISIQNWRDLLARAPGEELSEKAIVGLFGELEVLETILRLGGELDAWTGWRKDHSDFRLPRLAIEVKSTTSSHYRRVRINGLEQLADPEDGSRLVLVLRRLELSPDGRSVPDLIDAILRLGVPFSELHRCLSHIGYSDRHRDRYSTLRFASREIALRLIDDRHPRLTSRMLEDRVDLSSIDRIDYELNLNNDAEADMEESLDDLLRRHLGAS